MCKLNVILDTEERRYDEAPDAKCGMSQERIRFNTDVMFYVAKHMAMPLDRTADLMRRRGSFRELQRAYRHRHSMSAQAIANEISNRLATI